jgi:hypothetical protein
VDRQFPLLPLVSKMGRRGAHPQAKSGIESTASNMTCCRRYRPFVSRQLMAMFQRVLSVLCLLYRHAPTDNTGRKYGRI